MSEPNTIPAPLVVYEPTEAAIAEMATKYQGLNAVEKYEETRVAIG